MSVNEAVVIQEPPDPTAEQRIRREAMLQSVKQQLTGYRQEAHLFCAGYLILTMRNESATDIMAFIRELHKRCPDLITSDWNFLRSWHDGEHAWLKHQLKVRGGES